MILAFSFFFQFFPADELFAGRPRLRLPEQKFADVFCAGVGAALDSGFEEECGGTVDSGIAELSDTDEESGRVSSVAGLGRPVGLRKPAASILPATSR